MRGGGIRSTAAFLCVSSKGCSTFAALRVLNVRICCFSLSLTDTIYRESLVFVVQEKQFEDASAVVW